MLAAELFRVRPFIVSQVGRLRVGARLKSPADANQVRNRHVRRERIASRLPHFPLHVNTRWLYCVWAAMNEQAITRLQQNICRRITFQCQIQADTEDLCLAVRQVPKNLRVIDICVWSNAAGQVHGIAQMDLPGGAVRSRSADIAPHRNGRRILEIEPAENADCIHGVKRRRLLRIRQGYLEIETLNGRVKIRRVQPDDFRVLFRGLRQQILVGSDNIRDLHVRAIG